MYMSRHNYSVNCPPRYSLRGGQDEEEKIERERRQRSAQLFGRRRHQRHPLERTTHHSTQHTSFIAEHINQSRNILVAIFSALFTFFAFVSACFLAPWLIAIYFVVKWCRKLWMSILEWRFKDLELIKWTTPRTAVDTRRNQGIITVLLKVKGDANKETIETVKTRIQEDIVEKRNSDGSLAYPHLKCVLSSGWGRYGWVKSSEENFKIDNHVMLGAPVFKGRPITDTNIQDYISDVISKMMVPELPPWQVCAVPATSSTSSDETPVSYLLIRVHHLYLSEDGLALGDLLMMEKSHPPHRLLQQQPPADPDADQVPTVQNILAGIFTPPVVIPQVLQHIGESMSNFWNWLVSQYDPLYNTDLLKKSNPYLTDFAVLAFIVLVKTINRYRQKNCKKDLSVILNKERMKRNLDATFFFSCVCSSLSVTNLLKICVNFWLLVLTGPMRLMIHLIKETPVYFYWLYLGHYFVQECLYLFSIIYTAPRVLFEEIFFPEHPNNVQQLQTSVCGRNVVSWSEPVPVELIRRIRQATGASTCEVLLSGTAASVRDYLREAGCDIPTAVMTTSRFMPQEHLLVGAAPPPAASTGMLCLPLPTATPRSRPLHNLRSLQQALDKARSKQAALYLASVYRLDYGLFTTILPSVFARACLYLLSRRYAVSLTEIDSTSPSNQLGERHRRLTWGPQVEKIMYWRPPQANVCLSITLMNYGGSVQLGVMAAAQLAPQHMHITRCFSTNLYQLAKAAGVSTMVTLPAVIPSEPQKQSDQQSEQE